MPKSNKRHGPATSAIRRRLSQQAQWAVSWAAEAFGIDVRSLAALRIVLASIVLIDLFGRSRHFAALYTDEGVLPRSVLIAELPTWVFSLNLMNGTFLIQAVLFTVTAFAALGLLVGYRTRLMSVIVWIMVLSIQWRNPYVLHGADQLLRVLLFWGMLLPLGVRWSIDERRQSSPESRSDHVLSMATAGILLQIALMYWTTAILKSGSEWRDDYTAIYYALSLDNLSSPFGTYLLQFPDLLKALTFGTIWLEFLGPVLLFTPIFRGPIRTIAVLMFMGLHFGILATMDIGYFPLLSAFSMVCFLPTYFWDHVVPRVHSFITSRIDSLGRLRPGELGNVGFHLPDPWSRLSLRTSSSQLLHDADVGPVPHPVEYANPPVQRRLGARQQSRPHPSKRGPVARSWIVANVIALLFVNYIFMWNLATVSDYSMPLPRYSLPVANLTGLDQNWNMFAPMPFIYTQWFLIPGELADGRQVDLMAPILQNDSGLIKDATWEKPDDVNDSFNGMYWQKYLEALSHTGADERLLQFGRYICRTWLGWYPEGPLQLQTFQIIYVTERNYPDGQTGTPEQRVIWEHTCW